MKQEKCVAIYSRKGCSIEMDKQIKRVVLLTADKTEGNLLFVSDWTK